MRFIERQSIDSNLLSLKDDLIPVDLTYNQHVNQRYTSTQSVNSFNPGSYLDILASKDSGSAIDFSESYYLLDFDVYAVNSAAPNVKVTLQQNNSTFVPPECFAQTLMDDARVIIGSTDINCMMSSPQLFQWTSALLEILDSKEKHHGGSRISHSGGAGTASSVYDTYIDSPNPFNLSMPNSIVNCDVWDVNQPLLAITKDNIENGVIQNGNAVYLHQLFTKQRYGISSRSKCCNCAKKSFPYCISSKNGCIWTNS